MEPNAENLQFYSNIYRYHRARGANAQALKIVNAQIKRSAENPIISTHQYDELLKDTDNYEEEIAFIPHRALKYKIFDESMLLRDEPLRYDYKFQESRAYILDRIGPEFYRPSITLTLVEDAEVIVINGNVLVIDCNGALLNDISVSEFPALALKKSQ